MAEREEDDDIRNTSCAVCSQILSFCVTAEGKMGWAHSQAEYEDHIAVPVARKELTVNPVCDFCCVADPVWKIPIEDNVYTIVSSTKTMVFDDKNGWAACNRCKGYVERGDIDILARYAVRHQPWVPEDKKELTIKNQEYIYSHILEKMTGPPYLYDWDGKRA